MQLKREMQPLTEGKAVKPLDLPIVYVFKCKECVEIWESTRPQRPTRPPPTTAANRPSLKLRPKILVLEKHIRIYPKDSKARDRLGELRKTSTLGRMSNLKPVQMLRFLPNLNLGN